MCGGTCADAAGIELRIELHHRLLFLMNEPGERFVDPGLCRVDRLSVVGELLGDDAADRLVMLSIVKSNRRIIVAPNRTVINAIPRSRRRRLRERGSCAIPDSDR